MKRSLKCPCGGESRKVLTVSLRVVGESASSDRTVGAMGSSASETAPSQPATEAGIYFVNSLAAWSHRPECHLALFEKSVWKR
jgi:hypothetical protein